MIELTNTVAQTIAPGQAVTFDKVLLHTGCGERHRNGSNFVKLRPCAVYEVQFSGNIAPSAAGPVQLALAISGYSLPETVMEYTSATPNVFGNVSTGTFVTNCCDDFDKVQVVNTGTTPVLLSANFNLRIKRIA